jgi:hypothetical protein
MSPSDMVTQLYPQAPDLIFVTFHDSQGYGGGILTRLHTGNLMRILCSNYETYHFNSGKLLFLDARLSMDVKIPLSLSRTALKFTQIAVQ